LKNGESKPLCPDSSACLPWQSGIRKKRCSI
jgi:hypothetical protein